MLQIADEFVENDGLKPCHEQNRSRDCRLCSAAIARTATRSDDAAGEEARDRSCRRGAQHQDGGDGRRTAMGCEFLRRLAHIHGDDYAQVVVGADDAVERSDDREPDEARIERGIEDVEFSEEARR